MAEPRTRFDKIVIRLKNNPILALVIVLGTIIISIATVTDAVKSLFSLIIREPAPIDISGQWVTDVLTNRFDENDTYRLFFNFKTEEHLLSGTMRKVAKRSDGYDIRKGIMDGKIKGDKISFYIQKAYIEESLQESPNTKTVQFKVFYHGTVSDDEIHFMRQDDRGHPPEKFTAKARGGTPLHKAVSQMQEEDVKLLLEADSNLNARDTFGSTPLHTAVQVRQFIYQQQKNADKELEKLFHIVKLLVENGADVNATDIRGATPLHKALLTGYPDLDVARVLLSNGADPNRKSRGNTFLCIAVSEERVEVVRLLLEANADPNLKCDTYRDLTPLHKAVATEQLEVAKLLLDASANVNAIRKYGETPLHRAMNTGQSEMVKLLLDAGANVNATSLGGDTPLHRAVNRGEKEVVKSLIEAGAMASAKDMHGNTPLHYAVINGEKEMVNILIAAGANVNTIRKDGYTPLHWAVYRQMSEIVKLLLAAGANVNVAKNGGYTPLHTAVDKVQKEMVELLLAAGADVNRIDKIGNTPLHIAASKSGYEVVEITKVLIRKGADVNLKNGKLETPLSIALREKSDVANLLLSDGGG